MESSIRTLLVCLFWIWSICSASAADLVSHATGNFTDAATWATLDATGSSINTSTTQTTLTTGNIDSPTFVLGASEIQGVAVKLASRAAGSPTNTITVIIRNSTTASNTCSVTANVSDLPESSAAASDGGWHFFKCSANFTPNGTDSYLIRITMNSTSTAVTLFTASATSGNWQRMLVRTATSAPAAGDDVHVMQTLDGSTNPATVTTRTVTMNSTASTDYGSANTSANQAAIDVSKGGTLTWGTTASTNYVLRLSGWLVVNSAATVNIGTSGTPIPGSSTAILEFDCAADGNFGIIARTGSTLQVFGSPRTAGKLVSWTKLTANMAASATSATIADDTGWLSGDVVWFASTSQTSTQGESVTLNADAGASSLAWTGGTANAHAGSASDNMQAEVVNVTRNVTFRSVTAANAALMYAFSSSNVDLAWMRVMNFGYNSNNTTPAIDIQTTTGSFDADHIVLLDIEGTGISTKATITTGTVDLQNVALVNVNTGTLTNESAVNIANAGAGLTVNNLVVIQDQGATAAVWISGAITAGSLTNIYLSGGTGIGLYSNVNTDYNSVTVGPVWIHSFSDVGIYISSATRNFHLDGPSYIYRNADGTSLVAVDLQGIHFNMTFDRLRMWGNGTAHFGATSGAYLNNIVCFDCRFYGDTTHGTNYGVYFDGTGSYLWVTNVRFEGGEFGVASSIRTTHALGDTRYDTIDLAQIAYINTVMASATEQSVGAVTQSNSYVSIVNQDATAGDNSVWTPTGTVARETTTFDVTPSVKITPSSATYKIDSAALQRGWGTLASVAASAVRTVTVKVRKDGTYNGSQPRLIVKANPIVGYNSDTVLDTVTVGANTWETLTATTSAATAAGVLEFVVDCDGTAGNVFVDSWTIDGQAVTDSVYFNGVPLAVGGMSAGGYSRSRIQR